MNISELIFAGFIGYVVTLTIKSIIDMANFHNLYKRIESDISILHLLRHRNTESCNGITGESQ